MNLYKAHFVHPYTQVPLIVYFNERDGLVTFEKDEEILKVIFQLKQDLLTNDDFKQNLDQATNMCNTQYPVDTFKDVYEFLDKLGIESTDIQFKQVFVH
ncbi:hypothetical protein [Halalkalibacter urbisdiaboli]|uniref:hypothetical protein n=1 Tax=Halalkalibacter urbisdiaboli TaxID=1960589 RepID=UPI000B43C8E6|nr:hypothetical protein [Halalkalibacter urbisdiaboli]